MTILSRGLKASKAPSTTMVAGETMRVGFITTSFPVADNPASGAFIAELARRLGSRVRLSVLTPGATSPERPAPDLPFDLHYFRYAPLGWQRLAHQPGGIPAALRENLRLIALLPLFLVAMFIGCARVARRSDIVHANWSVNGAVAGLASRLWGTPVVTTLRGSDIKRLGHSRLDRALMRLCLWTNARLVCVNENIRERVLELGARRPGNIAVIPNGVDDRFFSVERVENTSASEPLRIISIGSLIPRKGMDVLVEALCVAADATAAGVRILGDGPERHRLQAAIDKAGLHDRIDLVGTVSPAALPEYLANADVFVLPSRYEGRPNAVLEAMAAGLAVVASRIPGTTDLVTDGVTGLLFELDDSSALADCLLRLDRDAALRARLGRQARDFVRNGEFSWDRTADSYVELYQAVIGRN